MTGHVVPPKWKSWHLYLSSLFLYLFVGPWNGSLKKPSLAQDVLKVHLAESPSSLRKKVWLKNFVMFPKMRVFKIILGAQGRWQQTSSAHIQLHKR